MLVALTRKSGSHGAGQLHFAHGGADALTRLQHDREYALNLASISMKITKGSFTTSTEDFYVWGQFNSPTKARGVFTGVFTVKNKECKYNSVYWDAEMR